MTQPTSSCGSFWFPAYLSVGGKLPLSSVGLKRLALVAALLGATSCSTTLPAATPEAVVTPEATTAAPFYWPWSDGKAQQPPSIKPYRLPTMAGDDVNFQDRPAKPVKAPHIDSDAMFRYVSSCFPEKSKWNLDVRLKGQVALSGNVLDDDGIESSLGSSYVAIVANLPLYSAGEISREREREYKRRMDIAANVSNFISAIASRNHSVRELALYRSLEGRAAIRVQQGVVEVAEQVQYLENVASAQESLIKNEMTIMENRLKLVGMCDPINAEVINAWLTRVSAVPRPAKPAKPARKVIKKPRKSATQPSAKQPAQHKPVKQIYTKK
jgi:hypothetical protein